MTLHQYSYLKLLHIDQLIEKIHVQIYIYISLVYSMFSDRVGLPPHIIPSSGVSMKSIGTEFLGLDALPGVNHMRGMQYQIVINITFWPELN